MHSAITQGLQFRQGQFRERRWSIGTPAARYLEMDPLRFNVRKCPSGPDFLEGNGSHFGRDIKVSVREYVDGKPW